MDSSVDMMITRDRADSSDALVFRVEIFMKEFIRLIF